MLRNMLYVIVSDFKIIINYNNEQDYITLPPDVVRDGAVTDRNHLYYLLKKSLEKNRIRNGIKTKIIIFTSKTEYINRKIVKMGLKDIESYIYYEMLDIYKERIDDKRYVYTLTPYKEEYSAGIFVIEKKIIEKYIYIFEKLNLDIIAFNTAEDILFGKNIILTDFSHIGIYAEEKNNFCKTVFSKDISDYIKENMLFYDDLVYLTGHIELEYMNRDSQSIRRTLLLKLENFEKITEFYKEKYNIEKIYSIYSEEAVEELINNISKMNYIQKKKEKKLDFRLLILIFIVLINAVIYINYELEIRRQKEKLAELKSTRIKLEENIEKLDEKKLLKEKEKLKEKLKKEEEEKAEKAKNKEFIKDVNKLNKTTSEDFDILCYEYHNRKMFIEGISKKEEDIYNIEKTLDKEINIIDIRFEEGLYIFKIEII